QRINTLGHVYPAIGWVVARFHGANHPAMPPSVAFQTSPTHLAFGGYLGKQCDPFIANKAARLPVYTNVGVDTGAVSGGDLFRLPQGIDLERVRDRRGLVRRVDGVFRALAPRGA